MSTPTWLSTIEKLAPTIASAIGTPVAGMAVSSLEAVFGITGEDAEKTPQKIQEILNTGQLTGDQMVALKKSEQDFQAKMADLGIEPDRLAVEDRQSARQMQISAPSLVPEILSILIVLGFGGVMTAFLWGVKIVDNPIGMLLLGTLATAFTQVLNYWYGSTRQSANQVNLLAQSVPAHK